MKISESTLLPSKASAWNLQQRAPNSILPACAQCGTSVVPPWEQSAVPVRLAVWHSRHTPGASMTRPRSHHNSIPRRNVSEEASQPPFVLSQKKWYVQHKVRPKPTIQAAMAFRHTAKFQGWQFAPWSLNSLTDWHGTSHKLAFLLARWFFHTSAPFNRKNKSSPRERFNFADARGFLAMKLSYLKWLCGKCPYICSNTLLCLTLRMLEHTCRKKKKNEQLQSNSLLAGIIC